MAEIGGKKEGKKAGKSAPRSSPSGSTAHAASASDSSLHWHAHTVIRNPSENRPRIKEDLAAGRLLVVCILLAGFATTTTFTSFEAWRSSAGPISRKMEVFLWIRSTRSIPGRRGKPPSRMTASESVNASSYELVTCARLQQERRRWEGQERGPVRLVGLWSWESHVDVLDEGVGRVLDLHDDAAQDSHGLVDVQQAQ